MPFHETNSNLKRFSQRITFSKKRKSISILNCCWKMASENIQQLNHFHSKGNTPWTLPSARTSTRSSVSYKSLHRSRDGRLGKIVSAARAAREPSARRPTAALPARTAVDAPPNLKSAKGYFTLLTFIRWNQSQIRLCFYAGEISGIFQQISLEKNSILQKKKKKKQHNYCSVFWFFVLISWIVHVLEINQRNLMRLFYFSNIFINNDYYSCIIKQHGL